MLYLWGMEIGDKLIGPNGAKYKIVAVDGEYLAVELLDKERNLPKLMRIKESEIINYKNEKES